jgi:hypothetical protein
MSRVLHGKNHRNKHIQSVDIFVSLHITLSPPNLTPLLFTPTLATRLAQTHSNRLIGSQPTIHFSQSIGSLRLDYLTRQAKQHAQPSAERSSPDLMNKRLGRKWAERRADIIEDAHGSWDGKCLGDFVQSSARLVQVSIVMNGWSLNEGPNVHPRKIIREYVSLHFAASPKLTHVPPIII